MLTPNQLSPAHLYVLRAQKMNQNLRHENLGFLSFEKGMMPLNTPLQSLPKAFEAWDTLAANLPFHYKNQNLREAVKQLPLLIPDSENLPEEYLCRASMVLSILAHAYVRHNRKEDLNIPDSITIPWRIVTQRLGRPQPFLSYIDLILYNWKLKDSTTNLIVENLELLTPTVNNQEENIFYLTQTEIAFKTKEVLGSIVTIQDAIINNQKDKVVAELQSLKRVIGQVTKTSFLKINPNPRSATYVDPVVWAKTVAPFAVPLKEGVQGPSGTSSPFFHILDTFLERNKYQTILGKEALFIRDWYPLHWKNLLNAIDQVSLLAYLNKVNDSKLNGAFYDLMETYCGENGFLGVHKRKVYGYLQMAFKVGRSVTIGGFSGLFKERTWEEVDAELEQTRLERYVGKQSQCPYSGIISQTDLGKSEAKQVVLDISNSGLQYEAGDRCAILPKNQTQKVEEILKIINATGEEIVYLNSRWKHFLAKYCKKEHPTTTLAHFLHYANLKDASRVLEKCSYLTDCLTLDNGSISFLELAKQCTAMGMDIKPFLIPSLSDILLPETERMYSISSDFDSSKLRLTVGNANALVNGKPHEGLASTFLHNAPVNEAIPTRIVSPLQFSLPKNDFSTIYLFAGGTGIAPFKGFLEVLEKQHKLSRVRLFYCVKTEKHLLYLEELTRLFFEKKLSLQILLTRDSKLLDEEKSRLTRRFVYKDIKLNKSCKLVAFLPDIDTKLVVNDIIGNNKATEKGYFYTCGKAGFALHVMQFIKQILRTVVPSVSMTQEYFYQLFADGRYRQDIFTSPSEVSNKKQQNQYHLTDIIAHNNPERGYWIALNNKVYDLTEFKEIHPGGDKIIADNAGRDASHEFNKAGHHLSKEITSMLSMYYIGELKQVCFRNEALKLQYHDSISALHLVTEMTNTFYADHSYLAKSITLHDFEEEKTPYKLAIWKENHLRFSNEYASSIHQIFNDLFYTHPFYSKIKMAFESHLKFEWNDNFLFFPSKEDDSFAWSHLEILTQKNLKILEIIREMLCQLVQIFEKTSLISEENYEKQQNNVLEQAYKNLQALNEINLIPA